MSQTPLNPANRHRTAKRLWLPHPALSLFMLLLWLFLVNDVSAGQFILGALLAWLIPFLTQAFWPESMTLRRPGVALKLMLLVLYDIIIANLVLVVRVLGPERKLQPAFMIVPLDIEQDFTITLLASAISLTPGTVSADLDMEGRYLLVHSLHVDDPEAAVGEIKQRYEAPLKEIFECSK
jgi:multicomponent K+:H+ antiporter subunit E